MNEPQEMKIMSLEEYQSIERALEIAKRSLEKIAEDADDRDYYVETFAKEALAQIELTLGPLQLLQK